MVDAQSRGYTYPSGDHDRPFLTLVGQVRQWPTPTQRDHKSDASQKSSEEIYGKNGRPLARWIWELSRQWPTPSANEDAAVTTSGKMQRMLGIHPDVREQKTGALNPDWTECLMGWPVGWTALDPLPELVWPALHGLQVAPPGPYQHDWEPPRVATGVKDRAKRLRCIGNGQHPFTAVMAWTLRRPGGSD